MTFTRSWSPSIKGYKPLFSLESALARLCQRYNKRSIIFISMETAVGLLYQVFTCTYCFLNLYQRLNFMSSERGVCALALVNMAKYQIFLLIFVTMCIISLCQLSESFSVLVILKFQFQFHDNNFLPFRSHRRKARLVYRLVHSGISLIEKVFPSPILY